MHGSFCSAERLTNQHMRLANRLSGCARRLDRGNLRKFHELGHFWTNGLRSIKRLSLIVPDFRSRLPKRRVLSVDYEVDSGNCFLGTKGKKKYLVQEEVRDHLEFDVQWTWEAKDGEVLLWKTKGQPRAS